jgi:mono/diheme cytochrome c family protein
MPDAQRASRRPVCVLVPALVLFVSSAGHVLVTAQGQPAQRTVWDTPLYTEAQATRGNQAFSQSCNNCHTLADTGNRPLTGQKFMDGWTQRSVGDLLTFVSTNMPNGVAAGTLSAATYADLVAFILKSNGFPAGTTELAPGDTVAGVQIIPKEGAGDLPAGTLVRVVGCLAPKSGADWILTSATAPQRIDKAAAGADDASLALGDRTVPLKFVLTRLDGFVGHRLSVSGLLMGKGGAEGLNVTTVNRVAQTCP